MSLKALILYATMTGNTTIIAETFAEQLDYYGFEVTMVRVTPKMNWDEYRDRCYFDDYDIVLLGSPIAESTIISPMANLLRLGPWKGEGPAPYNPEGVMGDLTFRRDSLPLMGTMNPDWKPTLGVVFTTYGGSFYGPDEANAALELLSLHLKLRKVQTVGKFACAGRERPIPVKHYEKALEMPMKGEAHFVIQLYRQDPTLAFFDRFSAEEIEIISQLAKKAPPFDFTIPLYETRGGKMPGTFYWHYDLWSKPGDRDIVKARCFISDLIEDYFFTLDGKPREAYTTYISMS